MTNPMNPVLDTHSAVQLDCDKPAPKDKSAKSIDKELKLIKKRVTFKPSYGNEIFIGDIYLTTYYNGTPCLTMLDSETNEFLTKCTINPDSTEYLPDGCVAIKDWYENEGMAQALIDAGIISYLYIKLVIAGNMTAKVYQLLLPEDEAISMV